jgi:hypothetical protein
MFRDVVEIDSFCGDNDGTSGCTKAASPTEGLTSFQIKPFAVDLL